MNLSKNLTGYCVVVKRGNKIIRAGSKTKHPLGVFYPLPEVITIKTLCFDGQMRTTQMNVPAGIRVYGPAKVLMDMSSIENAVRI